MRSCSDSSGVSVSWEQEETDRLTFLCRRRQRETEGEDEDIFRESGADRTVPVVLIVIFNTVCIFKLRVQSDRRV